MHGLRTLEFVWFFHSINKNALFILIIVNNIYYPHLAKKNTIIIITITLTMIYLTPTPGLHNYPQFLHSCPMQETQWLFKWFLYLLPFWYPSLLNCILQMCSVQIFRIFYWQFSGVFGKSSELYCGLSMYQICYFCCILLVVKAMNLHE